jgi:preprotein translocase subunit SecB
MPYRSGEISFKKTELSVVSTISNSARTIKVLISYKADTELDGKELFTLAADYEGFFECAEGMSPELIEAFAKANAPAVIYPYLRSTVTLATVSAGFPPLNLPVINFTKLQVSVVKID